MAYKGRSIRTAVAATGFFVLAALALTAGTLLCARGVLDSLAAEGFSMAENGTGIYGANGPDHYEFLLAVVVLSLATMVLVPIVARSIRSGDQTRGVPVASAGVGLAALLFLMTIAIGSQMGRCVSDQGGSCYGSVSGMADVGTAASIFAFVGALFIGVILWLKSTHPISRSGVRPIRELHGSLPAQAGQQSLTAVLLEERQSERKREGS